MEFDLSSQPELIRLAQKDDQYSFQIFTQVQEILQNLHPKFLHYNTVNKYKSEIRVITRVVYYLLAQQTLGEEYANLRRFNQHDFDNEGLPVRKIRTLVFVALTALGPYIIDRIKPRYQKLQVENPRSMIPDFETVIDKLLKIRLAIFFIKGHYYEIPKLFTNIYHIFTRIPPKHGINYNLVGKLIVFQLLLQAYGFLRRFMAAKKIQKMMDLKPQVAQASGTQSCQLCFDVATDLSCTPCGHLFCWECVLPYAQQKQICPSCRGPCPPNKVVKLMNFD